MWSISRKYMISAAHRIEGHPKCGRLHGHNYEIEVTIEGYRLPSDGMLMDFGVMDSIVKPLIDKMDHRYLVSQSNIQAGCKYAAVAEENDDAFVLGIQASTAEELAKMIYGWLWPLLSPGHTIETIRISVIETPKSTATFMV